MGQYERHVFVCTSGETCPEQGDTEKFVKILRDRARQAGRGGDVRINKAGCFSQCGHGPMIVFYPEGVWYAGVQESDLEEIVTSHIVAGRPVERLRYAPGKSGANKRSEAELAEIKRAFEARTAAPPAAGPAWKRAGLAADVRANGMKEFSVDGVGVLVVHTGAGFAGFQALCPHEAIPLEQGICDGSVLTCMEHMWQFDLKTGGPLGDALEGLRRYEVKEERGELYIAL
jgi:(2Fe-2S) ferredoxin/nitrite reductase/ring-hydroxylating ferredoxin subunit